MLEAIRSLFRLRWTNTPVFYPLSAGNISRTFILSEGDTSISLELLTAVPTDPSRPSTHPTTGKNSSPPILFLHGGCGSASVWLPFQTYLSAHYPSTTYSLSLRNHGASTSIPYFSMVWGSAGRLDNLRADLLSAITHICSIEKQYPILVAHSSGGGLAQYTLATLFSIKPEMRLPALVLVDSVPNTGNFPLYLNWAKTDPWFMLRMLFHLYHPDSPLSSTTLVKNIFFCRQFPLSRVGEFMSWMPAYESVRWPMGMGGSFWGWLTGTPKWLMTRDVLRGFSWDSDRTQNKVCIMVGSEDAMYSKGMAERMVDDYRHGVSQLSLEKKTNRLVRDDVITRQELVVEGVQISSESAVTFIRVEGAGHHVQNDLQWRRAAEALTQFALQV